MKFGSVCSGIEAASVAWQPLGWHAEFFAEIARVPNLILRHHYPHVPNFGDLNAVASWPASVRIDALIGGTPCQSYSSAGLRAGLADPRGRLMLAYLACAQRYLPRWLLWENVPGVLSNNRGRSFATFLGGLAQLGYGWAYRVLDAQHFGVPQRRRRVFVVGHLGSWAGAAAVLFEQTSLRGDSPAGAFEEQEGAARTARRARSSRPGVTGTLVASGKAAGSATSQDAFSGLLLPCEAIAFNARQDPIHSTTCPPLDTDGTTLAVKCPAGVRRFTPLEWERLQGFPDGYTAVADPKYKDRRLISDGARYFALGNSMPVPAVRWLGQRIDLVDSILSTIRPKELLHA